MTSEEFMQTKVHPTRRQFSGVIAAYLAVFALMMVALFLAPGCGSLSPDGPYAGDEILYTADQTIVTSYDLLHTFVTWEYENRAALASQPEIKRAADHVRANAPQWIASASALREAYAANPTPETRRSLQGAIGVLRAALTEAVRYMAAGAPLTSRGETGPVGPIGAIEPPDAPSSAAISITNTPTLHASTR